MDKHKLTGDAPKDNDKLEVKLPNGGCEDILSQQTDSDKITIEEQTNMEITPKPKRHMPNALYINAIREYIELGYLNQDTFRDRENICSLSEVELLRRQMHKQERLGEMYRKEVIRLMKYTEDLKNANERLTAATVYKSGIFLKISRSVGLQVRLASKALRCIKRRRSQIKLQNSIAPTKGQQIMATFRAANTAKITSTNSIKKTIKTKNVSINNSQGQNSTVAAAATTSTANDVSN